jgi:hypothetical protein
VNRGAELHHLWLIRVDAGKTMADVHAALKAGGPPPAWVHDVGGPNASVPGVESTAVVDLAPGRYVLSCWIPSPDGAPHAMKGMTRELIVTPAAGKGARAVAARPATTMTLRDYDFVMSKPLVAGTQLVRIRNEAPQSHEALVIRLAPGKTAMDFAAWAEKPNGAPPAVPVGGVTGIARGGWNDVTLALEPGEYALICFVPDAKDGRPHFLHGMAKQFTVARAAGRGTASGTR